MTLCARKITAIPGLLSLVPPYLCLQQPYTKLQHLTSSSASQNLHSTVVYDCPLPTKCFFHAGIGGWLGAFWQQPGAVYFIPCARSLGLGVEYLHALLLSWITTRNLPFGYRRVKLMLGLNNVRKEDLDAFVVNNMLEDLSELLFSLLELVFGFVFLCLLITRALVCLITLPTTFQLCLHMLLIPHASEGSELWMALCRCRRHTWELFWIFSKKLCISEKWDLLATKVAHKWDPYEFARGD